MRTGLNRLFLVFCIGGTVAGCGVFGKAFKKNSGHSEGSEDDTTPGETPAIKINGNVEEWANRSIAALSLPAANGAVAKPYGSCDEYYQSMVAYAQAMEAIYVKRYLAWARYQIAVGGFGGIVNVPRPDSCPACDVGSAVDADDAAMSAESAKASNGAANDVAAPVLASGGETAANAAANAVKSEYSTNNQEADVDETDYVKSNGQFVFAAAGNLLRVMNLDGAVVFAAKIAGETPRGLHLAGDKLALVTESSVPNPYMAPVLTPAGTLGYWAAYWDTQRRAAWYSPQATNVHEFQIGADGTLTPVKDRRYFGSFRDGREIAGTVHLVLEKNLPWQILQSGFAPYLHPSYILINDESSLLAYAQRLAEDNLNAWRTLMFEEGDLMADQRSSYKAGQCQAFSRLNSATADAIAGGELLKAYQAWDQQIAYVPGINAGIYASYPVFPTYDHVTAVETFDLQGAKPDTAGMTISPVQPAVVYASASRLVVGSQRYQWLNYWKQIYVLPAVPSKPVACIGDPTLCSTLNATAVSGPVAVSIVPVAAVTQTTNWFDFLTFDLTAGGAVPSGIGTIPGTPLNSYAIDALGDTLRFVVTENQQTQYTGAGNVIVVKSNNTVGSLPYQPATQNQQVSSLKVVTKNGADWQVAASLTLEAGGSVCGVRFFDTAAFISTHCNADPLHAVDLKDPLHPREVGVMPDSMTSTYFHPMDDGKTLLALGRQGGATTVAMIDVSDLSAPSVLAKAVLRIGGSEAETDFKSFRFIPRLGLLVLPMQYPFRLELLAARRDAGFAHFGRIQLQDHLTAAFGINGDPRTMLFDDLLVGVFGNQDVGANLNYAAHAAELNFSDNLQLTYTNKATPGWPYFWVLDGGHDIAPKWRSATLLQ